MYGSKHTLQWRHNDHDGVSNHRRHSCLLSRLFRRRSKKTSKLRVTGLCEGNETLDRYVKWRLAHALGMLGTFSPQPLVSNPDMHYDMCVTHVPWCMSESLTSGSLWSRWQGKRSQHSRRMRNTQFYVSGKRPIHRWPVNSPHKGPLMRKIVPFDDGIMSSGYMRYPKCVITMNEDVLLHCQPERQN